jgi:predicted transcriptional regulator
MTANPTVVNTTTSIRDTAEIMASRRFRHLPVVGDASLVGIVDITDVCRVLLDAGVSGPPAAETGRGQAAPTAAEASDPEGYARLRKLSDLR